jgi:hypothetical protein
MIARRLSPCYFTRHVMHRVFISAVVFIIFGSNFAALRAASAGSDPPPSVSEKDDTSLVKAAFDATNWDDAQTMPFQLSAQVKLFDEHGKATDGQLTLLFAAQDRWREEINWFGGTTLQLVVGDRIWRKGPDQGTHPLLRLNTTLELYRWLGINPGSNSVWRQKDVQGTSARCVDIAFIATAHREICLDVKTGLPLRIKDESHELTILQGDFLPLGLKRFPHHIRYSLYGETILELNIDSVTVLENSPPDAFTPHEQAGSMPWCPDEKGPLFVLGKQALPYWGPARDRSDLRHRVLTIGTSPTSEFSLVVFDVGSDGKVRGVKFYDKHGVAVQSDYAAEKLRSVTFHPAMCGGKDVEAEFFFPAPLH